MTKINRKRSRFTKATSNRGTYRESSASTQPIHTERKSEILGVNTLYILHQESNSSIFVDRSQADREEFRENWCDRKGGSRTRVKRDGVRGREETW